MAKIVAYLPDLMFGSKVIALLEAAGHQVEYGSDQNKLSALAADADLLLFDLAAAAAPTMMLATDSSDKAEGPLDIYRSVIESSAGRELKALAVYAHVDVEMKKRADQAGFDLVVPRSRFMREAEELVSRLILQ